MSKFMIDCRELARNEEGAIDANLFIGLVGALCILTVAAIGFVLKYYHLEIGHHKDAGSNEQH